MTEKSSDTRFFPIFYFLFSWFHNWISFEYEKSVFCFWLEKIMLAIISTSSHIQIWHNNKFYERISSCIFVSFWNCCVMCCVWCVFSFILFRFQLNGGVFRGGLQFLHTGRRKHFVLDLIVMSVEFNQENVEQHYQCVHLGVQMKWNDCEINLFEA